MARSAGKGRVLEAKRRIALLTPYLPAPPHSGGRIRMHFLARALTRRFEVHLFSAADPHDQRTGLKAKELSMYASVHVSPRRVLVLDTRDRPARARSVSPPSLVRAVLHSHGQAPFDAIVVEHSYSAPPVRYLPGVPWVLDEHNVESEYTRARAQARSAGLPIVRNVVRLLDSRKIHALSRWEERAWHDASEVVCVSARDAERVQSVRGRPVPVIPNGVATEDVPFRRPSERTGHDILLVGTFEHPPNIAAAQWLARDILPRVRETEPRARLVLCGSRPARSVLDLASDHVVVTGSVPSVAPYLEQSRVYANAVQQGAGTSLKVLEALASGIPLVSTSIGARGFDLTSPDDYLLADDADSFVRQLLTCMRDSAARDDAAARGRVVAERCSWTKLGAEFADVVERILDP